MTSIGERLRRQRLQNRTSLEKISLETKIGVRLLEAIEAEQFEKLPGGVFRRSFVLQYAKALGLDEQEISDELNNLNQFDDVPAMPTADMIRNRDLGSDWQFNWPFDLSSIGSSTTGSLVVAVGVILGCAVVYSWWSAPRHAAAVKPSETIPMSPAPARPAVSQPASVPAAPIQADSAPAVNAALPKLEGSPVRVGLSAGEKTWISISSDGKNVFADALQPHETKLVEASEKVRMLIGNAGGLEISLNGKPIGPIGQRGEIRVIEFTPEGFQIVPRKPNI